MGDSGVEGAEAAGSEMKNNKNTDDFYGFFLDNAFAAGCGPLGSFCQKKTEREMQSCR